LPSKALDRLGPVLASRPAKPSGVDLNTTGTERCRCPQPLDVKKSKVEGKTEIHFTRPIPSGSIKVEIWFAKINRDVFASSVFTSMADLARYSRLPETNSSPLLDLNGLSPQDR
jgi:hypothetical protein